MSVKVNMPKQIGRIRMYRRVYEYMRKTDCASKLYFYGFSVNYEVFALCICKTVFALYRIYLEVNYI